MHLICVKVAAKPTYLNVEEVPEAVVSAERAIYRLVHVIVNAEEKSNS